MTSAVPSTNQTMRSDCHDNLDVLTKFATSKLSPVDKLHIKNHLKECSQCQNLVKHLQKRG